MTQTIIYNPFGEKSWQLLGSIRNIMPYGGRITQERMAGLQLTDFPSDRALDAISSGATVGGVTEGVGSAGEMYAPLLPFDHTKQRAEVVQLSLTVLTPQEYVALIMESLF